MTTDVIALTDRMPDPWSVVAGLSAAGPDATFTARAEGAVIQLADPLGRPLVSVEAPILVHTPGEVRRLLGPEIRVEGPVWWTEIHAATGADGAHALAGTIATRLTSLLGGQVWPPGFIAPNGGAAPVTGLTAVPTPENAPLAVDILTDKTAAVIQDRPVIALTSWLAEALRHARTTRRGLHLVTPAHTRLTLPTRTALRGTPNRWVIRDGDAAYYDGLSGAELHWHDGTFTPTGSERPAPAFAHATARAEADHGQQLLLTFVTRAPAAHDLVLGGALETTWQQLTGAAPVGWGTSEPAGLSWSRTDLTTLARRRAPRPTTLITVGHPEHPAIATIRVSRTTGGVEEHITLALGYPPNVRPPLDILPDLAEELVTRHGLVSLLAQHRRARLDLTVPPWLEGPPAPLAFVLGPEEAHPTGLPQATQLGPATRPGWYYPLTETGWPGLEHLTRTLRNQSSPHDT
ncbi:DUF6177 family protein [Streptomyces sp. MP131-18]|uniref:DUF6177 family protein n=1 Tax=Streptomyces sp. MP131-18 TaxID=1857892 RepID=UPI00097BB12E|nr:DUF6177 family protein [Streptomyces sp. MP131-18]ONK12172.1 hypothetical protein STBA_29110 [Streptomyces sp. MP131-18]